MEPEPSRSRSPILLTLLLAAALLLGAMGYYLAKPTLIARQFAAAIANGDYAKAESLFISRSGRPVAGDHDVFPGAKLTPKQVKGSEVIIEPIVFRDLVTGTRSISINVPRSRAGLMDESIISITANSRGLLMGWVISP